jgi:DNA-binding transcriptional ArsR family regulator
MTRSPDPDTVFRTLADPDCRSILASVDEPRTAKAIAERCDLSRTSAYRKLDALSEAGLVEERTDVRLDGHHTTTYVRDFEGMVVDYEAGDFDVEVLPAAVDTADGGGESPDERLERIWQAIGNEL